MVEKGLAVRLREARTEKGFSQQYVAEKIHISRQSISNWEAGRGYPDMDNLVILSNLYEVSLDWLLKGIKLEKDIREENLVLEETNERTFREILTILLVLVLSCHLPFVGMCVAIAVVIWMKKTERKYKWMYVVCAFVLEGAMLQ